MAETTTAPPTPSEAKISFGTKLKNLGSRIGTKIDSLSKPGNFEDSPAEKARIAEQTASKQQKIDAQIAQDKKNAADSRELINSYNEGNLQFLSGNAAHEAAVRALTDATQKVGKPESPENLELARGMLKEEPDVEENVNWEKADLAEQKATDAKWQKEVDEARNKAESQEAYASVQPQKPVEFSPAVYRKNLEGRFNLTSEDSYQQVLDLVEQSRTLRNQGLSEQALLKMLFDSNDEMEQEYAYEMLQEMPDSLQKDFIECSLGNLSLTDLQKRFRTAADVTADEAFEETPEGPLRSTTIAAANRVLELQKRIQDGGYVSDDELRSALIASNRASSKEWTWHREHIVTKEVEFWKKLAAQADLSIDRGKLVPSSIELDPKDGSLKEQLPKLLGDRNVDLNLKINEAQFQEYWKTLDPPEVKPEFLEVNRNTMVTTGLIKDVANLDFEVTKYYTGDKEFTITFKKKAP